MIDLLNRKKKKTDPAIILGNKYRDTVTGFEGVALGYSMWISGCDTVGLNRGVSKDGDLTDTSWFDINRVIDITEEKKEVDTIKNQGGPQLTPKEANY